MQKTKRILITGGTGNLGKVVVDLLVKKQFKISVLTSQGSSRHLNGVSFITGDLTHKESLAGLKNKFDVIVHCASNAMDSGITDIQGSQHLLAICQHTSVEHFIYLSIVGVDKSSFNYYQNKFRVENLIRESGIPFTILRATQFHDFVLQRIIQPIDKGGGIKLPVPQGLRFQSIDKKNIAEKIEEAIEKGPSNEIETIGGPEILTLEKMVDIYLKLLHREEKIESIPPVNDLHKIFTTGINLCPDHSYGKITWYDFLRGFLANENK